jgi:hypothetical protein
MDLIGKMPTAAPIATIAISPFCAPDSGLFVSTSSALSPRPPMRVALPLDSMLARVGNYAARRRQRFLSFHRINRRNSMIDNKLRINPEFAKELRERGKRLGWEGYAPKPESSRMRRQRESITSWMRSTRIRPSSCEADLALIRCKHVADLHRDYCKWFTDVAGIVPVKRGTFYRSLRSLGCELLRSNVLAIADVADHSIEKKVDTSVDSATLDSTATGGRNEPENSTNG